MSFADLGFVQRRQFLEENLATAMQNAGLEVSQDKDLGACLVVPRDYGSDSYDYIPIYPIICELEVALQ